ncbi:MAG: hypothetical protein JKY60_03275 [Kordiimonadaceae bacterium]|nr:hypothetical protein [Kordiimonadaceae bacterium]
MITVRPNLCALALFGLIILSEGAAAQDKGAVKDPVVEGLLEQIGILSEEQILKFFRRVDAQERTSSFLSSGSASGSPRIVEIDFLKKAGATAIKIAANRITSIEVVDQNGRPWPVKTFLPAPEGALEVKLLGSENSIVAVSPLTRHVRGNALMFLDGITAPINLTFETNPLVFDEPLTIKIRASVPTAGALSPDRTAQAGTEGYSVAELDYRRFIEGVIPEAATSLKVEASFDALAWSYNGLLVIKTEGQLLWPGQRYKYSKGSINLFVVDPIESLEFSINGEDKALQVEYP